MKGKCPCGVTHGPADPAMTRPGNPGKIVAVYQYVDEVNKVLFETVRFEPKTFRQRRPGQEHNWSIRGVRIILYNLPAILAAKLDQIVWIVEGEKDVNALTDFGILATCNPMGAGKWKNSFSEFLKGRHCRIIQDNDEKGRQHALQVAQSLQGKAASVKVIELPGLPEKGDVSDWLASGHDAKELADLADKVESTIEVDIRIAEVNRDNKWVSCQKNSEMWLLEKPIGKLIKFDSFSQCILVDGIKLADVHIVELISQIERDSRIKCPWSKTHMQDAIEQIAQQNRFNSLIEYLESLKWDGEYRVNSFFSDAYSVSYTPYSGECAKVLFLSAVARAFKPGCQADVMVVMIGPQGVGKSMGIAVLSPFPEWYADDLGCDLTEGKAGEGLQGKWLFEFSEFARVNRATLDTVKSFVSRRVDHYRPPYGRLSVDFPRSCVFIGTTNDQHPLRDVDNRRFMPIECMKGDIEWIKANRDQLWAEAVQRFKNNEQWWVDDPEMVSNCLNYQELARADDAWESILAERLDGWNKVLMEEAADKLGVATERLDKTTQTRIGIILKTIGFNKKRESTGSRRYYYARN